MTKNKYILFNGNKIYIKSYGYWVLQGFISAAYKLYYRKFKYHGWENVPTNKPILFAISHTNAFMDSLAFAATKNTQVFQLARGDAWKGKFLIKAFESFHMLPIWREQDGVDTKAMNEPTFEACFDVLACNGMVGIYPEGNCINEKHIRPLKKGICRIAFGAEKKYNYALDIQIVPVGITYSDAENFKKTCVINFGKAIAVKEYIEAYKLNPAKTSVELKNVIEEGMKQTIVHIEKSPYHKDIEYISDFYSRYKLSSENKAIEPISKLYYDRQSVAVIEKLKNTDEEKMTVLSNTYKQYNAAMHKLRFRENTFDEAKHVSFVIYLMGIYFLLFLPIFLFGYITSYFPLLIPQKFVESKIKQKIFWSSIKFLIGIILFPLWYMMLSIGFYMYTDSLFSALLFFIFLPIAGHIAYYYRSDFKKWTSVLRYKKMKKNNTTQYTSLTTMRNTLITLLTQIENSI